MLNFFDYHAYPGPFMNVPPSIFRKYAPAVVIQGKVESFPKAGSVLLVTLLSVSLLLVVVLTLVVTVRMELRNVTLAQDDLMARGNARLGADLAVARLQELLGPDQRVSATGDLFRADLATSSNPTNLYQSSLTSQPGKRFWTGAWDSTAYDERDAAAKGFLGWLVSGEADEVERVGQAVEASDMVPLVGLGTVSEPLQQVWVAPREIENAAGTKTGEFAFWVGDEGVKARFNLEDAHRDAATREERQQRLQSAQRHAAEMIHLTVNPGTNQTQSLAEAGLYPENSPEFRARRERLLLMDQLPLLGWDLNSRDDYAALRGERFHDLSLTSRGVFSNTRDGGLMRDLSLAFEMDLDDFLAHDFFGSGSPLSEPMPYWPGAASVRPPLVPVFSLEGQDLRDALGGDFPENSPATGQNPHRTVAPAVRGAPWQLLRNYYRLYKRNDPDRARYGFSSQTENFRDLGGRRYYNARSAWPDANMYRIGRRYGQDVNAWTNAEDYGPSGTNYSEAFPLGRAVYPGISPVITRMQLVFSVRTHPVAGSPGYYRADLYIDPIVTIMNPYDVPIRTGPAVGQSLDISLELLDMFFRMRLNGRASEDAEFEEILRDASNSLGTPSALHYNRERDEAFRIRLNMGTELRMEPGEVVVFSGSSGNPVPYNRTASGGDSPSGVDLELAPGISAYLPEESGIHLPDAFRKLIDWFTEPGAPGRDPRHEDRGTVRELMAGDDVEFRVRESRYRIRITGGANRYGSAGGQIPFFESMDGPLHNFRTSFPQPIEVDLPGIRLEKRPFGIMDWYVKPADDERPFFMDHYNLRAATTEQGREGGFHTKLYPGGLVEDMGNITGQTSTNLNPPGAWLNYQGRNAYWGPSRGNAGRTRVPIFSLPGLPLQSLGAFQNLMLQPMGDDPGLIFGNSRAPLFGVPGQKVALQEMEDHSFWGVSKLPGQGGRQPARRLSQTLTRPDWSYLYNEALWDGFFFSTAGDPSEFNAFLNDSVPLPNGTLSPWRKETAASLLFDTAGIRPHAPERAAAHLIREGAFNVNATSVEAWRAMLSSTRGLSLDVEGSGTLRSLDGTVFSRSLLPEDTQNQVWSGFRHLTDGQINTLAEQIVREVRIRGPFLNLSDFVNRRLAPANDDTLRAGALQAAIDASNLNGNGFTRTLRTAGLAATANYTSWMRDNIGDHLDHPILAGLPGYLTQADVLTVIGPMLSARSDTFTVRAFGEHGGARAWCELTVQRVPEYLEEGVAPWVRPEDAGAVNQTFGRRFMITSFRWLGEDEV